MLNLIFAIKEMVMGLVYVTVKKTMVDMHGANSLEWQLHGGTYSEVSEGLDWTSIGFH